MSANAAAVAYRALRLALDKCGGRNADDAIRWINGLSVEDRNALTEEARATAE